MEKGPEPRYLSDLNAGYETSFEAEVVALPPGGVVLSGSLFYPHGGGQPCDRGTLTLPDASRVDVVDVSHQGGLTVHRLGRKGGSGLQRGMVVRGNLDWERRFTHMRLHTAQHLISALAYRRFQVRTSGARLAGRGGYLDLERPLPGAEDLVALGREANEEFFSRHVPVSLRFVSREEFSAMPNRSGTGKLPPGVERLRLVVIGSADLAPCGGTHLRDTIEVGGVTSLRQEPLPVGGARVSFELTDGRPTAPAGSPTEAPSTPRA